MHSLLTRLLLLTLALIPQMASAQDAKATLPFLSPMFGDNMVLQREHKAPIWGWSDPGAKVAVTVASADHTGTHVVTTTADSQGKWMAQLGPYKAGGPYTITVDGPHKATLNNILFGDVWICSGQSNMEMGIGNVNNADQEIAEANYPEIRLYTVPHQIALDPQDLTSGQWSVCSPTTVHTGGWNGFTAVGYFFGRTLYQKLKIPIGLIHTSWGGTIAEAWTSAEALKAMPDFLPNLAQLDQMRADQHKTEFDMANAMTEWYAKNDPGSAGGLGWADPAFDTSGWKTMNLPTNWEVAGLPDFDGIVWFRKEFELPTDAVGKDIVLHLGPIDDQDTTWVNGVRVGGMGAWDQIRNYTVPASALKPGKNLISVRVLDTGGNGGIYGKPEQMFVEIPGHDSISLVGPWLYRDSVPLAKTAPLPMRLTDNPNVTTVLYNGMIAPVIPYAIKGAIWYQGESNAGRAYQYRTLLPTMIKDWRSRWGVGDFPFYIVQLANFQKSQPQPGEDAWAELREAQQMTAQSVPKSGLAVTIDIGDAADIHPKDKQDVGKRLALNALALTYGEKREYSGPVYKSMKQEGDKIRLSFDHIGGGLMAKGGEKLQGFAVAGDDKKFVWADAVIEGQTIVVSSPQAPHPVAVRYAWATNPVCNLFNKEGLPASPFRTDDWPGITVNAK